MPSKSDVHKKCRKELRDTLCRNISEALCNAHKDQYAAIQYISVLTGAKEGTVKKWYYGLNPPDATHLLLLMMHYPSILRVVLHAIGQQKLWDCVVREGIHKQMIEAITASDPTYHIWGDTDGTPSVNKSTQNAGRLNDRQLWFLDELYHKGRMNNKDIAEFWDISLRAAKRDTEGLTKAGLICTKRGGSMSWYELVEKSDE